MFCFAVVLIWVISKRMRYKHLYLWGLLHLSWNNRAIFPVSMKNSWEIRMQLVAPNPNKTPTVSIFNGVFFKYLPTKPLAQVPFGDNIFN